MTLSLPLRCLEEGMDFAKVNTPFILGTSGKARIDVATVRWVPASCWELQGRRLGSIARDS